MGLATTVSKVAAETPGVDAVMRDIRDAADRMYDFLFEPAFSDGPAHNRKVVNISHMADADGFGAEMQHRTLEAIVTLISGGKLNGNVTFEHERLMSFSDHLDSPNNYRTLMQKHGRGKTTFYQISDMGSADLDQITQEFQQGNVIDHHPTTGTLSDRFGEVNPHRHDMGGDTLSGAGGTYLVLDTIIEKLLHDRRIGLSKEVKSEIKRLREQALLLALAGSSADMIRNEGMTRLLYERAEQFKLLEQLPIGGYGHTSKAIMKMIAEASIPFNLKYPNLRRKEFWGAIAQTIKRGKKHLSPHEQKIADTIYDEFGSVFMLEYKQGGHPASGIDKRQLYVNRMNAQMLSDEEITRINGLFIDLGINDEVLRRERVLVGGVSTTSVQVNEEGTRVKPSEFDFFDDDIYSTERRYINAGMILFPALKAKAEEDRRTGATAFLPNLYTKNRDDIKAFPHKRMGELTSDELSLFIRFWQENVRAFADPFNREEFLDEVEMDNYVTRQKKRLDPILSGKTISELGSYMTSLSKTGFRQALVDALFGHGKLQNLGRAQVKRANFLYRQIIYSGMRKAEQQMRGGGEFMMEIQPRVYAINFDFLGSVVAEVVDRKTKEGIVEKDALRGLDLRTLVGVFAGIMANTRKLPGHYALIFAGTTDYDMLKQGTPGEKISGRKPQYAEHVFPDLHLGDDLMVHFGGGGHPGAASARIPIERKPEFLEWLAGFEVHDEMYQEFLRRVGRTTFRKPYEEEIVPRRRMRPRKTSLDWTVEGLLQAENETLTIKGSAWGQGHLEFSPPKGSQADPALSSLAGGVIIPLDYLDPKLIFKRHLLENIGVPDLLYVSLGDDGKAHVQALDVKGASRLGSDEARKRIGVSAGQVAAWNTYNLITRHELFERAVLKAADHVGGSDVVFEDGCFITTMTGFKSDEFSQYLRDFGKITRRRVLRFDEEGVSIGKTARKRHGMYYQTSNAMDRAGIIALPIKVWRTSGLKHKIDQMWNRMTTSGLIHPLPLQVVREFNDAGEPLVSLDYAPREGLRTYRHFERDDLVRAIERIEQFDGLEDAVEQLNRDLDSELTKYRRRERHLKSEAEGLKRKIEGHKTRREQALADLEMRAARCFARLGITAPGILGEDMRIGVSDGFVTQAMKDIRRLERGPPERMRTYELGDIEHALEVIVKYGFKARERDLRTGTGHASSFEELPKALETANESAMLENDHLYKVYVAVAGWMRNKYKGNRQKAREANSTSVERQREAKRFRKWQSKQYGKEYTKLVAEHDRFEEHHGPLREMLSEMMQLTNSRIERVHHAMGLARSGHISKGSEMPFSYENVDENVRRLLERLGDLEEDMELYEARLRRLERHPENIENLPRWMRDYVREMRGMTGRDPEPKNPSLLPYLREPGNVAALMHRFSREVHHAKRVCDAYLRLVEEVKLEHESMEQQLESLRRQSLESAQQAGEYQGRLEQICRLRERIRKEGFTDHVSSAQELFDGEHPYHEVQERQLEEMRRRLESWDGNIERRRETFMGAHELAMRDVRYEVRSGPIRRFMLDLLPGPKLYQVDIVPIIQLSEATSSRPSAR